MIAPAADAGGRREYRIGFLNNMGPLGFATADRQFSHLLDLGGNGRAWRLVRFAISMPPALDRTADALVSRYLPSSEIAEQAIDALVISGAEPKCDDLRDEPYWSEFVSILKWAESNGVPLLLSCLAAHAAVLHRDGIVRRRFPDKRFGLFSERIVSDHPLAAGLAPPIAFPHSRWNEVRAADLVECGYTVITSDGDGQVNCFLKEERGLVVAFQGHPEYEPLTLLNEYKRDVRRFLTGESGRYPDLPRDYLAREQAEQLTEFRRRALAEPSVALAQEIQALDLHVADFAPWRRNAAMLCRNWFAWVETHMGAKSERVSPRPGGWP